MVGACGEQLIEWAPLPLLGAWPRAGRAVLDDRRLLGAVVPPAKGAAFVDRVQGVDEQHGAREVDPDAPALLAELVQQLGLGGAVEAPPDDGARDAMEVGVAHDDPPRQPGASSAPRRSRSQPAAEISVACRRPIGQPRPCGLASLHTR